MSRDPHYVDPEDPWEEFNPDRRTRPKWTIPKSDNEKRILRAVGRKWYQSRGERTQIITVVKAMMPLKDGTSRFPTEWVEYCCEWAEKKRRSRQLVQMPGLLSLIYRDEARKIWLESQEKGAKPSRKRVLKLFEAEDE